MKRLGTKLALFSVSVAALGLVAFLVVGTGTQRLHPQAASAAGSGPELTLDVTSGGLCNGTACYAYSLFQALIDWGVYDPTASEDGAGPNTCSDLIVNGGEDGIDRFDSDCVTFELIYNPAPLVDEIKWPDVAPGALFGADMGPGRLVRGGLTSLLPPYPASSHTGPVIELDMSCPATPVQTTVSIVPYGDPLAVSSGALFIEPDMTTQVEPKVSSITLQCGKQTGPADTDGDGCSDAKENGTNAALGGDRDWLNPNDFYDVNGDKVIDLANDILGVIGHIGSEPGPPYDVLYDRGPWTGTNSWNGTTAPDGVIDSPNDVMGVLGQHGHDCT
jgi:hypothetical protein